MSKSKQISFGIVGAGFAGLRCADILLQHGCKVTIFEARNRLGGRVAQSAYFRHPVDLVPNSSRLSENIGYDALDKVYVTSPSALWDSALPDGYSLSNGVDPSGVTPDLAATTAPLHQPPSRDRATHYPGFTHWLAPAYATDTKSQAWEQQDMNLAALPPSCAHPTILFYIYGDCSIHIANLISSSTNSVDRDKKLLGFFKPYFSLLSNYSASDPERTPKAVLATAWANDGFAGCGSYSNFQVGLERADEDIEVMRHGVPECGLWFAGEHTAPFAALGTNTGA